MDERSIPAANVAELTESRAQLIRVLNAGGPTHAPLATARAQLMFDCWMEEQEENWQPEDITHCRDGFNMALSEANAAVLTAAPAPAPVVAQAPAPTPAPVPEMAMYTVYFDHDISTLDGNAVAMKNDIVARIKNSGATSVLVNGYADRSGDRPYNSLLAERRAATVSAALDAAGIAPTVGFESFSEDRPALQTADGVRERLNRRVVVTVRK